MLFAMPFQADVYNVFIASPSELSDERKLATEVVHEWNDHNSRAESVVLLPIRWETHAVPQSGIHPQQAIDAQLLSKCDVLVAMFWTMLGAGTGDGSSGTVEEIKQFIAAAKPALIYFSNRPIDPSRIDPDEQKKLREFRNEITKNALLGHFSQPAELRDMLLRHLTEQVRQLKSKLPVVPKHVEETPQKIEMQSPLITETDLILLATKRGTRKLLETLRTVGMAWREQAVPSDGGSFRYWAQMPSGKPKVICGFDVGGKRFNAKAGLLYAWIRYEAAVELGEFENKEALLQEFEAFAVAKKGKTRFWVLISTLIEAQRLATVLASWAGHAERLRTKAASI